MALVSDLEATVAMQIILTAVSQREESLGTGRMYTTPLKSTSNYSYDW